MPNSLSQPVETIMTSPVRSVGPESSAAEAAGLMIALHVSGVPVVDAEGHPIGVVSESDFLTGDEASREQRREAWLKIIAGGQPLSESYLEDLGQAAGTVRQVMRSPAITVDAAQPIAAAVDLLNRHRIKRLPVTRDGRLIGIVTRADLLHHLFPSADHPKHAMPADPGPGGRPIPRAPEPAPATATEEHADEGLSATAFRHLTSAFERHKHDEALHAAEAARRRQEAEIAAMLEAPYTENEWVHLVQAAHRAAENGLSECPALRFPAKLCTDGGRAINVGDPDWPATLRGKAARFYLRWQSELEPVGFGLAAHIASFPEGLPGDAELILIWGRDA